MSRSALPIALLLALCARTAFAFPPCPSLSLDIVQAQDPVRAPREGVEPWFLFAYTMDGHKDVKAALEQPVDKENRTYGWDTGTCRTGTQVPVPGPNAGTAHLNATPIRDADFAGYGTLVLPDIRANDPGREVRHILDFSVDGKPLAAAGDWFDVAELELRWTHPLSTTHPHQISALYRVRKQMTASGRPELLVIESRRAWPSEPGDPTHVIESTVARIAVDPSTHALPIQLLWSQRTRTVAGDGFIDDPHLPESIGEPVSKFGEASIDTSMSIIRNGVGTRTETGEGTVAQPTVDTTVTVLGANGVVLYQRQLQDQWATFMGMGLLDYTAQSELPYANDKPAFDHMALSGELL